jgi:hypothetical protein
MKYFKNIYLCLFVYILLVKNVKLDLPVHCLSSKIEGYWIIYMGDNIHDKDLKCGHKRPDQNLDHLDTDLDKVFKHKYEQVVRLERPDKVLSIRTNKLIGKWTMIYDEGFEFSINDQIYFAFSRYKKIGRFSATNTDTEETKGYINICNKTFLGWYHNKNTLMNYGCFWGEKLDEKRFSKIDKERISYRNVLSYKKIPLKSDSNNTNNDNKFNNIDEIISNNNKRKEDDFNKMRRNYINNNRNRVLQNQRNLNNNNKNRNNNNDNKKNNNRISKKNNKNNMNNNNDNNSNHELNKRDKKDKNNKEDFSNFSFDELTNNNNNKDKDKDKDEGFSYEDFIHSLNGNEKKNGKIGNVKDGFNDIPHLDILFDENQEEDNNSNNNKNIKKNEDNNFLEMKTVTKLFQPDLDYIKKINNPHNKYLWTAKIHDDFIGKSYSQMRNLLGRKNYLKKNNIDEDDLEEIRAEISQIKIENKKKASKNKDEDTETNRLISNSKKDIQNFLSFGSFLEFSSFVSSLSFSSISAKGKLNIFSGSKIKSENSIRTKSNLNSNSNENDKEYDSNTNSKSSEMVDSELEMDKETEIDKDIEKSNNNNKDSLNGNFGGRNEQNKNDNNENEFDIEISDSINSNQEKKSFGKFGKLPKNFDWRNVDGTNYDSPIRKQGECGSCYAIAAVSVLESRIRIASNNRLKPLLSPSSVLSCSRYNQGCFGGYPYLVGKFGKEFGFVEENCQPYTETDDKCFDFCFHEKRYKIKDYG